MELPIKYFSNLNVSYYGGSLISCPPNWRAENIICQYSKFYYIQDGKCVIEIDDMKYEGKCGSWFLIPAGKKHSFYHVDENYIKKYWFHFDIENLFTMIEFPFCTEAKNNKKIKNMFVKIIKGNEGTLHDFLYLKALIIELVALYLSNFEITSFNPPVAIYPDLSPVLQYMKNNMNKRLTVFELAEIVHLHPNYFIKLFKEKFGYSPIKYINKIKMETAKAMLIDRSIPISQIMDSTGFEDPAHFSKFFKQYSGYSPKEFRNINISR